MKTKYALLILFISVASYSYAATDYSKIHKDISVMSQILRGVFEEEGGCRGCKTTVSGRYLAEQGAVFTIAPSKTYIRYISSSDHDHDHDYEYDYNFENWEFTGMEDLAEIPGMVSEILADIDIDLTGTHRIRENITIDRESRGRMRALSRERRHLEEEVRDIKIEMIHAEDEERDGQEQRLSEINKQIKTLEEKREKMDELLNQRRSEYEQRRKEAREKVNSRVQERLVAFDNLILDTFCDYGANLKNVPNDQRVTVILENVTRTEPKNKAKIYVFNKKDLSACQDNGIDSKELKQRTIVYNF